MRIHVSIQFYERLFDFSVLKVPAKYIGLLDSHSFCRLVPERNRRSEPENRTLLL
jgi:hypothetical protein